MGIESFGTPENLKDQHERDSLNAIREGTAMPLPDFLRESPEARQAYAEALKNFENVRPLLDELDPEQRQQVVESFMEVLDEAGNESSINLTEMGIRVLAFSTLRRGTDVMQTHAEGVYNSPIGAAYVLGVTAFGVYQGYKVLKHLYEGVRAGRANRSNVDEIREQFKQALNA